MRKPPAKTVSVEVPALAGKGYPPCRGQAGYAAGRGGRAEAHGAQWANRAPQTPTSPRSSRSRRPPAWQEEAHWSQARAIRSAAPATGRVAPMTNPK